MVERTIFKHKVSSAVDEKGMPASKMEDFFNLVRSKELSSFRRRLNNQVAGFIARKGSEVIGNKDVEEW